MKVLMPLFLLMLMLSGHASAQEVPVNIAREENGATVEVSSCAENYDPAYVLRGDPVGLAFSQGGGWMDGTPGEFPDWLTVRFAHEEIIDTINLYTLQDHLDPMYEITPYLDFNLYGLRDFEIQALVDGEWTTVPGGRVTGNIRVCTSVRFAPLRVSAIRVVCHASADGSSRITAIEAMTPGAASEPDVYENVALSSNRTRISATSESSDLYPVQSLIEGDRTGYAFGSYGGWMASQDDPKPQITLEFDSVYPLGSVSLYSLPDAVAGEPTLADQATLYGICDYNIEYHDGTEWKLLPGGEVRGETAVWSRLTFDTVYAQALRITVLKTRGGSARLTQIEAFTPRPKQYLSNTSRIFTEKGLMYQICVPTDESGRRFPTKSEWDNLGFLGTNYFEPPLYNHTLSSQIPDLKWSICYFPYGTPGANKSDHFLNAEARADIGNMTSISLGDELWYEKSYEKQCRDLALAIRDLYPGVAVHTNQIGHAYPNGTSQWSEHELRSFIRTAKPDFMSFDDYFFCETGSDRYINYDIISVTALYRKVSMEGHDGTGEQPITFGQYVSGYHTGVNVYAVGKYTLSESQLNVVPYITMTLGGKWITEFRWEYDTGKPNEDFVLFNTEENTTATYDQYAALSKRVRAYAPHLSKLYSTDARIVLGQHLFRGDATLNRQPNYIDLFTANQEYGLLDVCAENKQAQNASLPGDIVIGYFDVLPGVDRDTLPCSAPKYLMVTNALSAGNGQIDPALQHGSSAETAQTVTLTFAWDVPLYLIDPKTGESTPVKLTKQSDGTFTLCLEIPGGQGELMYIEGETESPCDVTIAAPHTPRVPAAPLNASKEPLVVTNPAVISDEIPAIPTGANLARGCMYTVSLAAGHEKYKDPNNTLLTDGLISQEINDHLTSGYIVLSDGLDITVDLGAVKEICRVRSHRCAGTKPYNADGMSVSVSADGVAFTPCGETTLLPSGEGGLWYEIGFEPVQARYVTFHFSKTYTNIQETWVFLDELQVLSSPADAQTRYVPASDERNLALNAAYRSSVLPSGIAGDDSGKELVDGVLAQSQANDKAWQAHMNADYLHTIDLGDVYDISLVRSSFLRDASVNALLPVSVKCYGSLDGGSYSLLGTGTIYPDETRENVFQFETRVPYARARYIKLEIKSPIVECMVYEDEIQIFGK